MDKKRINDTLDFSDMSGGKNNSRPQNAINDNQVYDCSNVILERIGYTRAPGRVGIDTEPALPAHCRMLNFYKKSSSLESLYAISNSKLHLVDKTDGDLTEKYTLAADTEGYGANFKGKFFFQSGLNLVKIESDDTAYRVGIAAPSGVTASAAGASGTLAAGNYIVYAAYARKVSGTIVLYSYPQTVGTVAISGTQGILISDFANSADPQVNDKVIFVIEPSGTAAYFYHETDNNTTTTFTINSNAAKNIFLIMDVVSVANYPIPRFDGICFYDNRMVGWYGQKLYWSIKSGNVYDVERFPEENFRELPHDIISCFQLNGLLCINTIFGVYTISDGDMSGKYDQVEEYLYFLSQRLHKPYKGLVWGLTNDGVRYFDGKSFSQDLSKDIKPDIDRISFTDNFLPCLEIYRRKGKRTELHISFRDNNLSSLNNTSTLVLNLDSIVIVDNENYKAAWESWSEGVNFMTVSNSGELFSAQNKDDAGAQVLKEIGKVNRYFYNVTGSFITDITPKECYVVTKARTVDIRGIAIFDIAYVLSLMNALGAIRFGLLDNSGFYYDSSVHESGGMPILFSAPITFPVRFPAQNPVCSDIKLPGGKAKGKMVYLKISQTSDDPTFNIFNILLHYTLENSNIS